MRNPAATDGAAAAPVQVQSTLDNWYTVQLRRSRRMKRGFLRNGGRDEIRTTNNETQKGRTEGGKRGTVENWH
jgi:hypothetical protein